MNFLLKEIDTMGEIRTCDLLIERRGSEPLHPGDSTILTMYLKASPQCRLLENAKEFKLTFNGMFAWILFKFVECYLCTTPAPVSSNLAIKLYTQVNGSFSSNEAHETEAFFFPNCDHDMKKKQKKTCVIFCLLFSKSGSDFKSFEQHVWWLVKVQTLAKPEFDAEIHMIYSICVKSYGSMQQCIDNYFCTRFDLESFAKEAQVYTF